MTFASLFCFPDILKQWAASLKRSILKETSWSCKTNKLSWNKKVWITKNSHEKYLVTNKIDLKLPLNLYIALCLLSWGLNFRMFFNFLGPIRMFWSLGLEYKVLEKCIQNAFWNIFTWEFIRYWASSGVAKRHFSGEVQKMQNLSKMISSGCFVCFLLVNGAQHSPLSFV